MEPGRDRLLIEHKPQNLREAFLQAWLFTQQNKFSDERSYGPYLGLCAAVDDELESTVLQRLSSMGGELLAAVRKTNDPDFVCHNFQKHQLLRYPGRAVAGFEPSEKFKSRHAPTRLHRCFVISCIGSHSYAAATHATENVTYLVHPDVCFEAVIEKVRAVSRKCLPGDHTRASRIVMWDGTSPDL